VEKIPACLAKWIEQKGEKRTERLVETELREPLESHKGGITRVWGHLRSGHYLTKDSKAGKAGRETRGAGLLRVSPNLEFSFGISKTRV
jgi:hypothetical protein